MILPRLSLKEPKMADHPKEDAVGFYERAAREREGKGGAAKPGLTRDYENAALAGVSAEAAGLSFGCGDPLAFADVREGESVLDLGCGAGLDLLIAAEKTGPDGRVIGVDASAEMLGRAAENAKKAGLAGRIDLRQGTIEALPVTDASIDWVISNCVVNLSPDKFKVFAEIVRVLKAGGKILIADLVVDDLPDWVRTYAGDGAAWLRGVVSEAEHKRCAETAGLVDVRIVGRTPLDAGMVRVLIEEELPIALGEIAARFEMGKSAFLDMAADALAGRIVSIKLRARKPGA
jgi:SAM-dependent methyltransferase